MEKGGITGMAKSPKSPKTIKRDVKTPEMPPLEPDDVVLRVVVPEYPLIAGMFEKIRYVQQSPLPPPVFYLMAVGLRGLTFVKIPINLKEDRLYLRSSIIKLLLLCGLDKTLVENVIEKYNDIKNPNDEAARSILNAIFKVAKYHCDVNNIEFLTD
jgi:hypothetical protein